MDNFKAVYRILSVLEKSMDLLELNVSQIDAKALNVSDVRAFFRADHAEKLRLFLYRPPQRRG